MTTTPRVVSDDSSYFLRLPPELRLMVYRYVLRQQEVIFPYEANGILRFRKCDRNTTPLTQAIYEYCQLEGFLDYTIRCDPALDTSIIYVNKEIYQEAWPVIFEANSFNFGSGGMRGMSMLYPKSFNQIRSLDIWNFNVLLRSHVFPKSLRNVTLGIPRLDMWPIGCWKIVVRKLGNSGMSRLSFHGTESPQLRQALLAFMADKQSMVSTLH